MFSQVLSVSLFLPGSLWCKCGIFDVIPEVSYAVFVFVFCFLYFSYVLFFSSDFHSVFQVTYPFFCLSLLLNFSSVSFTCFCLFVCFVLLLFVFFSSSRSLVNISCIFSIFFFSEFLDYLHHQYSEFFFWKVAYLYFI